MGNPYAHIARGNWCVQNSVMKYYFEDDLRKNPLSFKKLAAMVDKSDPARKTEEHAFATWCAGEIDRMNGSEVVFPDGMQGFRSWMRAEFTSGGIPKAQLEGVWRLPFPEEMWRIYRVQMMARHNLSKLPLPWF